MKRPSQSSSPFPLILPVTTSRRFRVAALRLLPMLASTTALLLGSPLARGAASYPATVLADGPVAYYRMEELSGTTATDSSGNSRDGSYIFSTGGSPHLGLPGITTNSI